MHRFAALYWFVSAAIAAPAIAADIANVQTHGEVPAGWVVGPAPATPDDVSCANGAQGWKVERNGKDGFVIAPDGRPPAALSIALADGVMWATNRGEFGGKVEWQAANADQRDLITAANPVAFMTLQDTVFFAEGLSHGPYFPTEPDKNEANKRIVKMVRSDGRWKVDATMPLAMVPRVVQQSGEHALILANRGVIAANLRSMEASQLHRNDDWKLLYPNSIVDTGGGNYLVGLRSAVVKLTRNGTQLDEQWWRPAACARMERASISGCTCLPPL